MTSSRHTAFIKGAVFLAIASLLHACGGGGGSASKPTLGTSTQPASSATTASHVSVSSVTSSVTQSESSRVAITSVSSVTSSVTQSESSTVTITLEATQGASIIGERIQTVDKGSSLVGDILEIKDGYRFLRWSDGVTSPQRSGVVVNNSMTVTAIVEPEDIWLKFADSALFFDYSSTPTTQLISIRLPQEYDTNADYTINFANSKDALDQGNFLSQLKPTLIIESDDSALLTVDTFTLPKHTNLYVEITQNANPIIKRSLQLPKAQIASEFAKPIQNENGEIVVFGARNASNYYAVFPINLDTTTDHISSALPIESPIIQGHLTATTSDNDDGIFLAGDIISINGKSASRISHLSKDDIVTNYSTAGLPNNFDIFELNFNGKTLFAMLKDKSSNFAIASFSPETKTLIAYKPIQQDISEFVTSKNGIWLRTTEKQQFYGVSAPFNNPTEIIFLNLDADLKTINEFTLNVSGNIKRLHPIENKGDEILIISGKMDTASDSKGKTFGGENEWCFLLGNDGSYLKTLVQDNENQIVDTAIRENSLILLSEKNYSRRVTSYQLIFDKEISLANDPLFSAESHNFISRITIKNKTIIGQSNISPEFYIYPTGMSPERIFFFNEKENAFQQLFSTTFSTVTAYKNNLFALNYLGTGLYNEKAVEPDSGFNSVTVDTKGTVTNSKLSPTNLRLSKNHIYQVNDSSVAFTSLTNSILSNTISFQKDNGNTRIQSITPYQDGALIGIGYYDGASPMTDLVFSSQDGGSQSVKLTTNVVFADIQSDSENIYLKGSFSSINDVNLNGFAILDKNGTLKAPPANQVSLTKYDMSHSDFIQYISQSTDFSADNSVLYFLNTHDKYTQNPSIMKLEKNGTFEIFYPFDFGPYLAPSRAEKITAKDGYIYVQGYHTLKNEKSSNFLTIFNNQLSPIYSSKDDEYAYDLNIFNDIAYIGGLLNEGSMKKFSIRAVDLKTL